MKEKEFREELNKRYFEEGILLPIYYFPDEDNDNHILIDFDSMREEYEEKIEELKELIEEKDELTKTIKQKMKQIKEKQK